MSAFDLKNRMQMQVLLDFVINCVECYCVHIRDSEWYICTFSSDKIAIVLRAYSNYTATCIGNTVTMHVMHSHSFSTACLLAMFIL